MSTHQEKISIAIKVPTKLVTLWIFLLTLLSPIITLSGNTMVETSDAQWQLVSAEQPSYVRLKTKERAFVGTLIVEDYGKPGVVYVRAPNHYWLATEVGVRLPLSINDTLFPPLHKKRVEVKGKMQKDLQEKDRLFVGWIREIHNSNTTGDN